MKDPDSALHRLLRSAAQAPEENAAAPPFGFETRVVALWRSAGSLGGGNGGLLRLVRRVALAATVVILLGGAASFREFHETLAAIEPAENEFAIADSAIQNEFYQ